MRRKRKKEGEEVREHYDDDDVDDGKIGWRHIYAQSDVN